MLKLRRRRHWKLWRLAKIAKDRLKLMDELYDQCRGANFTFHKALPKLTILGKWYDFPIIHPDKRHVCPKVNRPAANVDSTPTS